MVDQIVHSAAEIELELNWLKEILKVRSALNNKQSTKYKDVFDIQAPHFNGSTSKYAHFIKDNHLSNKERFLMILAAVPHIKPELLDIFLTKNDQTQQVYTEFGGKTVSDPWRSRE